MWEKVSLVRSHPWPFFLVKRQDPILSRTALFWELQITTMVSSIPDPRYQPEWRLLSSGSWWSPAPPFLRFVSHHGPPAPFVTFTIGLPYFPFLVLYAIVYVLHHHQYHLSLRAISLPSFSCSREETRNQRDGFFNMEEGARDWNRPTLQHPCPSNLVFILRKVMHLWWRFSFLFDSWDITEFRLFGHSDFEQSWMLLRLFSERGKKQHNCSAGDKSLHWKEPAAEKDERRSLLRETVHSRGRLKKQ